MTLFARSLPFRSLLRPRFRPFASSPPLPQQRPSPRRRWAYLLGGLALGGSAVVFVDNFFYAQSLGRTARAFYYGTLVALDYKLNFVPSNVDNIDKLHERVAQRMLYVCTKNGGGYIKLLQSLAIQASLLPAPYRTAFASVFDAAPQIPYSDVERVFRAEFGVGPEEAFEVFERRAGASASVAQVHRARMRGTGEWVAVKIQKPAIPLQIEWDLFSYRALLWTYERLFDIPCYFIADYVTDQIRKETDFANEAHNASKTRSLLLSEPSLASKVVVPRVFPQWSSGKVLTAEWFDGCRLTDKESLRRWGLGEKETMDIALGAFSAMIFSWGWVHCDPHPGNILVRPNPSNPRHPQIILIDHGLYIPLTETFRHQYSLLWRSLFAMDTETVERIGKEWGIGNSDMFASATLLRPTRLKRKEAKSAKENAEREEGVVSRFERERSAKVLLKSMLEHEELIPKEIIFITRCMRMMQANNQSLGSPSNRINILAHWAVTGLALHPSPSPSPSPSSPSSPAFHLTRSLRALLTPTGLAALLRHQLQLLTFRLTVLAIDFTFLIARVRQWLWRDEGFEVLLSRQLTGMARDELGIEIDESAFAG